MSKHKKIKTVNRITMNKKLFNSQDIKEVRTMEDYFASFNGWKMKGKK